MTDTGNPSRCSMETPISKIPISCRTGRTPEAARLFKPWLPILEKYLQPELHQSAAGVFD
jgi:hypothetical protein